MIVKISTDMKVYNWPAVSFRFITDIDQKWEKISLNYIQVNVKISEYTNSNHHFSSNLLNLHANLNFTSKIGLIFCLILCMIPNNIANHDWHQMRYFLPILI